MTPTSISTNLPIDALERVEALVDMMREYVAGHAFQLSTRCRPEFFMLTHNLDNLHELIAQMQDTQAEYSEDERAGG